MGISLEGRMHAFPQRTPKVTGVTEAGAKVRFLPENGQRSSSSRISRSARPRVGVAAMTSGTTLVQGAEVCLGEG